MVALGSAAVIAVYAAGYARTRAAAERLAAEEHRRPMIPAPPDAGPAPTMPEPPATLRPTPVEHSSPRIETPRREHRRTERTPVTPAAAAAHDAMHHEEHGTRSAEHGTIDSSTNPAVVPAPAAPPVPVADVKPAEPAVPPKPALKDGTYYGWGTSRHGDIQAAVVIENGRITAASISQCLTRYSCSWIAPLVPQVVQRQSAEVDYVSGATQSTNAFYYAVLEALSKAK